MPDPFRGFPSKSKYVRERFKEGLSPRQIHDESKLPLNNIHQALYVYSGWKNLKKAARRRGMSLLELKNHILRIIEDEDMIDAILDDDVARGGKK